MSSAPAIGPETCTPNAHRRIIDDFVAKGWDTTSWRDIAKLRLGIGRLAAEYEKHGIGVAIDSCNVRPDAFRFRRRSGRVVLQFMEVIISHPISHKKLLMLAALYDAMIETPHMRFQCFFVGGDRVVRQLVFRVAKEVTL